jgi:hypothetical protein
VNEVREAEGYESLGDEYDVPAKEEAQLQLVN